MNIVVQESTKCTPFEAMFSRLPRLPIELNHLEHHSPEEVLLQTATAPSFDANYVVAKRQAMEEQVRS